MFIAKFYYPKDTRVNYLYEDSNNNLCGYSIDGGLFKEIDKNLLNNIINLFKINDNCCELLEYKDYTVYYDPITKFKHYLKNGKYDYDMFFENNGYNALEYSLKDNSKMSMVKTFAVLGAVLIVGKGFINLFTDVRLPEKINYSIDASTYNSSNHASPIDSHTAEKYVLDSPYLDSEEKRFLTESTILHDILPYYEDTFMVTEIKSRLNNLKIRLYDSDDINYDPNVVGYYSPLHNNVINIYENNNIKENDRTKYNYILGHEYVHLLQGHSDYVYLKESTAQLMAEEYFNSTYYTYKEGVRTLKLLTSIIGPEPILKAVFASNPKELNGILENNLDKNDYNKLTDFLKNSPRDVVDQEEDIRNILTKLYKNIYDKDIKEDGNILYEIFYSKEDNFKCNSVIESSYPYSFLNKSNMYDIKYTIRIPYLLKEYPNNNYIDGKNYNAVKKELSYEEYMEMKDSEEDTFSYESNHPTGRLINSEFKIYRDYRSLLSDDENNTIETLALDDAIKKEYVIVSTNQYVKEGESLSDDWTYVVHPTGEKVTFRRGKSNLENGIVDEKGAFLEVTVPAMDKRFDVSNSYNKSRGSK